MKRTIGILCIMVAMAGQINADNAYDKVMSGQKLPPEEAAKLEKILEESPDNLDARKQLLGYCFMRQYSEPAAKSTRQKHVLWMIGHAPEDEIHSTPYTELNRHMDGKSYDEGAALWKKQIETHPERVAVLGHAANYFGLYAPELAEKYLISAAELDPENPEWPEKLGQLYSRSDTGTPKENAARELAQLRKAYALSDPMGQGYLLADMAKAAVAAGEYESAKEYAEQMLNRPGFDWNSGNNMHHGNMVLGLVALHEGDVDAAKKYLILSGKTKGSPQLDSFGPNMTLAKALLEQGESDAVLEYFTLCSGFWKMQRGRLDDWAALVKGGRIPDFGANLKY